jgi:hypothetical protein
MQKRDDYGTLGTTPAPTRRTLLIKLNGNSTGCSMRFLILASIFLLAIADTASALPVEASHPVAGFLRRLEEKGVVPLGFISTLPRDASEVSRILQLAEKKKSSLTSWDRRNLEKYLDEFVHERKEKGTRLTYKDEKVLIHGDIEYFTGFYFRDSITTWERYAFGSFTPRLQMYFQNSAYLTTSLTVGRTQSGSNLFNRGDTYDPQRGLPYNSGRGENAEKYNNFDAFRLIMGVGDAKLGIEAGQDWNEWGPGHWQHSTLSARPYFWVSDSLKASPTVGYDGTTAPGSHRIGYRYPGEGPPLPQLRFRMGGTRWEYVKIIGQRTGLWKDSSALLIADRLQLKTGSFRIGLSQIMAIGSRTPGLITLLPGIPLKVTEHEGGDQDNIAMSGDLEWIRPGFGRLYGEFFLDDYTGGESLNFWRNKYSSVIGGSFQDPFGLPAEVHVEYSTVDPWVYQHHISNTQMNHYGALLGSHQPPNSRAISTSVKIPLPGTVEATLEWNFRQRDLDSKGGSIFDVHESPDPIVKQFLAQNVETRNQAMLTADWRWKRHVQMKAGAGWRKIETWRGNPGIDFSTPVFTVETYLRY